MNELHNLGCGLMGCGCLLMLLPLGIVLALFLAAVVASL